MSEKSDNNIKLSKEQKQQVKKAYSMKEILRKIYIGEVLKTARKDIMKKEAKLGRKIDKYDGRMKERITRNAAKKVKRRIEVAVIAASIGLTGGYLGHNMLTVGANNKAIESAEENTQEDELLIKEFDEKGKSFRQGLQESADRLEEIKREVRKEVGNLTTRTGVLNYAKDIYIEDHNLNNENKITSRDQIEIWQHGLGQEGSSTQTVYFEDVAENGDKIVRKTIKGIAENEGINANSNSYLTYFTAYVKTDEFNKTESATKYYGNCINVYSSDEEVNEYSNSTLSNVLNVMYKAYNLMGNIEVGRLDNIEERKKSLIDAVVEYRSNQIRSEKNQSTENLKTTIQKNEEER